MAGRPDIVLILTDQLRYDCVGFNGSPVVTTPVIDAFAAEGMAFHRCYTPTGLCSPARTSMLTGRYPHRHGVMNNVSGPDAFADDVAADEVMLPRILAEAGYRTAFVGKYHVAAHEAPKRHGFSDSIGTGYYWGDDDFRSWRAALGHPVTSDVPAYPVTLFTKTGVPVHGRDLVPAEATPPAYLVDRALGFVEDAVARDEPFLLVLSFIGPHWPHMAPEPWWSRYDPDSIEPWPSFGDTYEGKPGALQKMLVHAGVEDWTWEDWRHVVASYFAGVSFHDEMIGRFLRGLADRGRGDVLTVFTTDHGDLTGSHRLFNKGPAMYEDVYRIPMAVRWPGVVAPGSSSDAFVSNLDLLPTVLAAAGVEVPGGLDGLDLAPLLRGMRPTSWRDSWFAQYHGDEHGVYSQRMVHTGRYKLVLNAYDVDELYDLGADPWELENLAARPVHAALRRDLEARLLTWMRETEDPLVRGAAPYLRHDRS